MTSLDLGDKFDTSNVTNMSYMFLWCGNKAMTSLDLGDNFNTSNVTDMSYMFDGCGSGAMTSLDLGNKFDTRNATDMKYMFWFCGNTSMTKLNLGPAFTKIANSNATMFTCTGKSGAVINAPESIYKDNTSFKLSSTDTTTASGTIKVDTGRTVVPKYKPEWTVTGTAVDKTAKKLTINLKGATNTENYTSNVTTALKAEDISIFIDGTELNGVSKSVSVANPTTGASITQTITITNFEETLRQAGKSYKEWSGNITLKIAGRGEATSTYSKNVLIDAYGNQNMSATDETGTWVDVSFKDSTTSSANTSGKLFADVISPEFTYEYANTTIDHGNKKVTIKFSIADKYFSTSTLTTDTTASNITVTVDGKTISNDKKKLSHTDINGTVDGQTIKIGEEYTLELTNLDQGGGGDYSGIVKLAFAEGAGTDKSGNKSIAKTITIGIDEPTTGDGHTTGQVVDVVSPVWKTENLNIDKTNQKVTVDLIATDKYLTGTENSTLTASNITLTVDGDTNANTAITKTLSTPTFSTNSTTGLKEIKYTLTLTNWEQASKQSGKSFLEYSGTTKITIPAGTITDQYTNKSLAKTFDLGHIDVIKPRIEKVSATKDATAKTETIVFNVIDKYLDTSDAVALNEIAVSVGGETVQVSATAESGKLTGKLTRVTANDVSTTVNGSSQVVSQQYQLVLSDFEQTRGSGNLYKNWSGTVSIAVAAGAVKDKTSGGSVNTSDKTTITGDFVDFINPEFTYEYSETTIDHGNKKVTIIFSIADKYFSSSTLTSDTTASNIAVTVDGKTISDDKKNLSKTDITSTVDGTANKKVGERYTLVLTNLDQGGGGDYSGIVKLAFAEGTVTDTTGNKSVAKTLTVGIDDPTTGDGHTSGQIVDVVSPVWKTQNINIDKTNKKVTVDLIATDKYLTGTSNSTLTTSDISLTVDGDTNANTAITKTLSAATFSTNSSTGLKEIKYTLTLSNWEQASKQSGKTFLEYSGTTKITIAAGVVTDQYTNTNKAQAFTLGHVDFIKPRIEKASVTKDASAGTETIVFNVIDKYLDTSDAVSLSEISVTVGGETVQVTTGTESGKLTGSLTRVTANDVSATVNGTSQVVSQQYKLVLSNFEQTRGSGKLYKNWSGTVSLTVAAGAVKDKTSASSVNTNDSTTITGDFVDFIKPEFTYEYSETTIDHGNKKVTIIFSIADKYFSASTLTSDTTASKIDVTVDGKTISDDKKSLSKTDITSTVDGTANKKVGERYTLVLTNLDQGDGEDYSGIVKLAFAEGTVTDTTGNKSIAKTITIGIDDPTTGDGDNDGQIVDVVSPVWSIASKDLDAGVIKIRVKDKYLTKASSKFELTKEKITVFVNGTESTSIGKTLTGPTEITANKEYEYTLTLTNIEPSGGGYTEFTPIDPIIGGTAKYRDENGGDVVIRMLAGSVTDQYGNKTEQQDLAIGNLDMTGPEIYYIQKTRDMENNKEIIVFNVTDKNYDEDNPITVDELNVWIDGTQVDDQITKTMTKAVAIKTTIDGKTEVVGHQYTLEIGSIAETDTEFTSSNRKYRELSGTLQIKINKDAASDLKGNTLNEQTTTITDTTDLVNPEVKYEYATSNINKTDKTFTMVFEMVDKYYKESASTALTINDLTIKIDNEVPDWNEVTRSFSVENVSAKVNGADKVIGKRYTLKLSNLEQLQVKDGDNYLDYSGVVTVGIPADKMVDEIGNKNVAKTITSGVNIPGGTGSGQVVDVVSPLIEKESSSASAINKTATLKFKVTDKYFKESTITKDNIKILVNGTETTSGITKTLSSTELKEDRVTGDTTTNVQYGVEYTLTVTGFATDANQVKVQIPAGLVTDNYDNGNKVTDMIVYNVLRKEDIDGYIEITSEYAFLGNASIQRQNIENVTFERSVPSTVYDATTGKYVNSTAWDVSAQQDKSIIAWYETSNAKGALKVHIGSNDEIFANQDSKYLFSAIGYADICTATEAVTNLDLLNVKNVTSMSRMFSAFGYNAMTSFKLPSTFDTSNVINMGAMFMRCGQNAMTTLELGMNFNTTNVVIMDSMFNNCGREKLTKLDLSSGTSATNTTQFNTSKVTSMEFVFANCGSTAMTNLNLGNNFDTSNVTSMKYMFLNTGENNMTSLDLGNKFNTSKVTNMYRMFTNCGTEKMTSLNLGSKFNTSKVTDMQMMFYNCGNKALTSLDLGDLFYTTNVKDMYKMFYNCGTGAMTTLDLGAAFTKIPSGKLTKQTSIYGDWEVEKVTSYNAYDDMFTNCGKAGLVVYAPESIYSNRTSFYAK